MSETKYSQRDLNRIKRRKKMYRRRMFFYTILILILFLIIIFIKSLPFFQSKETIQPFNWFLDKAYRDSISEVRTQKPTYSNLNDQLNAIYDEFEFMKKELMPNSNHITQAGSYAYDVAEIRAYIRGEKEYTGKDKLVFLTFDDGPNANSTPEILKILKDNDVHGTFFLIGNKIGENSSELLHQLIYQGNSVGVHSFNHNYEELYPEKNANVEKIKEEVLLSEARFKKVFGESFFTRVWRYPGGHMSWQNTAPVDTTLSQIGIEWIDWNAMTGDAEPRANRPTTTEEMVAMVNRTLNKNLHTDVAVVLLHDSKSKQLTIDSLPQIIQYFKDHGYKFGILK